MSSNTGLETTPLSLASLVQAEEAFAKAQKRAREIFDEQDQGTRSDGAVTFMLEVSMTNEGSGAISLGMKSSVKEPKVEMRTLRVQDTREGMLLFKATQPELPNVSPIRRDSRAD